MASGKLVRASYDKNVISALIVVLSATSTWEQTVCRDTNFLCSSWSSRGLCQTQRDFMRSSCSQTCGFCFTEVLFPDDVSGAPAVGIAKPSIGNPQFVCGRYDRFTSFNRQKRQLGNAFNNILGAVGSVLQRPGSSGSSTNNRPSLPGFSSNNRPSLPGFNSNNRPSLPGFNSNNRPTLPNFDNNIRPSRPSFSIPGFPNNIIPTNFIPTNIIPSTIRPINIGPITIAPNTGRPSTSTVSTQTIFSTSLPAPTPAPGAIPAPDPDPVGGGIPGLLPTVGPIFTVETVTTRIPRPPFPRPRPVPTRRPSPRPPTRPKPTPVRITTTRPIPMPRPIQNTVTTIPEELPSLSDAFCGSSPITDRYLLSAAHCFPDPNLRFQVVLGNLDFGSPGGGNSRSQTLDIEQLIIHPQYNHRSRIRYNDIALLKTRQTIRFSPTVFPNCIMPQSRDFSGLPLKVSGFGFVNATHRSPVLQEAVLEGSNARNCEGRYLNAGFDLVLRRTYPELLQRKGILCASAEGRSACQGDSGGPLTFSDRGTTYLVGIVSVGPTCLASHLPSLPGIYTDVSSFVEWIDSVIYGT